MVNFLIGLMTLPLKKSLLQRWKQIQIYLTSRGLNTTLNNSLCPAAYKEFLVIAFYKTT